MIAIKITQIIVYTLAATFISFACYPWYISILRYFKAWKTIRDDAVTWDKATIFRWLHAHKAWTPTMWWWLLLLVMGFLIAWSYILKHYGYINNTLVTPKETYIVLFALFSMWLIGLVDDVLNIRNYKWYKWLPASIKLIWMILFAGFISYWFHFRIWSNDINLWPLIDWSIALPRIWLMFEGQYIWIAYMFITFMMTLTITNAINITDGLDWLVGWIVLMILAVCWLLTFSFGWYLTTTVIWIVVWWLVAFLRFNINPAKVFMWDAWALWLWWLISALFYLIWVKIWFFIPFIILFGLCLLELSSSFLQIFRKKVFKRKLFKIAPFHHLLEHQWWSETTIVMKLRLVQWILCLITLILVIYSIKW